MLEDRYHSFFLAMVVPKGQPGRHTYVREFIEEAKASGLVKQTVERAGLRGVQIAAQATWATVGPSPISVVRRMSRGSCAGNGRARCMVWRLSHITRSPTRHLCA